MDEIQKINSDTILKSVKDKIKEAFVNLIPDEQWDLLVKKEIDSYFEVKYVDDYNTRKTVSDFKTDVYKILREEVEKRAKEYLVDNFQPVWNINGVNKCNALIEEMIIHNSGKILTDMIGGVLQNALSSAGYQMNNRY